MEEPGRGGVLADREIEPAVSVVIRIRGTTLLAVDNQAGALPRDGLEPSFAISKHQQATAGIEAWRIDLGREEILREEDVFISVAIEIGYARIERRGQLCRVGKGVCLEVIAAIQKHHVIQRRHAEACGFGSGRPQHPIDAGIGIRRERPQSHAGARKCLREPVERQERGDSVNARIFLGREDVGAPPSGEETDEQEQRARLSRASVGSSAPARRNDIEPAGAIEIARSRSGSPSPSMSENSTAEIMPSPANRAVFALSRTSFPSRLWYRCDAGDSG